MESLDKPAPTGAETDRAWYATRDGQYADALRMWDDIVARDRGFGRYNMNRGITRLLTADYRGALEDFRLCREGPARTIPVPFVGTALWLLGQRDLACEDWGCEISRHRSREITNTDESGNSVSGLLWWASYHEGLASWRQPAVEELRRWWRMKWCQKSYWPGSIVGFLLDKVPDRPLTAVADPTSPYRYRDRTRAHFFLAAKRLAAGDMDAYREHVRLAASQEDDAITRPEYHLARAELTALE
jgi:hypothetical protein